MTSLDRDMFAFATLCLPPSLSQLTQHHYPLVVEQGLPSGPHSHLSTMELTPVVPEMFPQEVFEGQLTKRALRVGGGTGPCKVTELQPPPFKSLPVLQNLQETVKESSAQPTCGGASSACCPGSRCKVRTQSERVFWFVFFFFCSADLTFSPSLPVSQLCSWRLLWQTTQVILLICSSCINIHTQLLCPFCLLLTALQGTGTVRHASVDLLQ